MCGPSRPSFLCDCVPPGMSPPPDRLVLLVPALLVVAGCATPNLGDAERVSVLTPARMPSDSCVLDVFFVRFPLADPRGNEQLWQAVDEQHFPAELRGRLGPNGFRLGVVGGQIPVALSELLELENKPPPTGQASQIDVAELDTPPRVTRCRLSIRPGRRKEILASTVLDKVTVLIRDPDELNGETFIKAQAVLAVRAFPQADGRIRVELVPELHHDEPRQRWVGSHGTWRLDPGRPRRVFDRMAISATLSPGSILLVSSLPHLPGSLGHHFFTAEDNGQPQQKLLAIRLSQTQHNALFSRPEVLELD